MIDTLIQFFKKSPEKTAGEVPEGMERRRGGVCRVPHVQEDCEGLAEGTRLE